MNLIIETQKSNDQGVVYITKNISLDSVTELTHSGIKFFPEYLKNEKIITWYLTEKTPILSQNIFL